jgi:hypothetical protein
VRKRHELSIYMFIYCRAKAVNGLWKSERGEVGRGFRKQKNKGAGTAPESRKYLGWKGLKEVTYFLPFFAFLVLFLAAFFFAGM